MSFNFSDNDDEDDDLDLDAFDDTGLLALTSREEQGAQKSTDASASSPAAAAAGVSTTNASEDVGEFGEESDDGGDWDNIDWEDADDESDNDEEEADNIDAPSQFPTQPVMINFGKKVGKSNDPDEGKDEESTKGENNDADDDKGKKPPKKRKRTTRVLCNVPYETQQIVLNIRRSQMLCCMVHSMRLSFICSDRCAFDDRGEDYELMHLALSLIPQEFHEQQTDTAETSKLKSPPEQQAPAHYSIPSKNQLQQFSKWFFQFVNQAGERRRAAMERNIAQGATTPTASRRRSSRQSGKKILAEKKKSANKDDKAMKKQNSTTAEADNSESISYSYNTNTTTPLDLLQILKLLSPQYDEDPQLCLEVEGIDAINAVKQITSQQKVLIFLLMIRTLGWRARYVTSLNPMALELTVDHPLLATLKPPKNSSRKLKKMMRKLVRVVNDGGMSSDGHKKKKQKCDPKSTGEAIELLSSDDDDENQVPKKEAKSIPPQSTPRQTRVCSDDGLLAWVEVLCRDSGDSITQSKLPSKPAAAMWVPIHPEQESFDIPQDVESILAWREMNNNQSPNNQNTMVTSSSATKMRNGKWGQPKSLKLRHAHEFAKKTPVSYVIAVEHSPLDSRTTSQPIGKLLQGVRFTDVTPRYANSWSSTLRLRGAMRKDIISGGGKCVDKWWESSLKNINRHCRGRRPKFNSGEDGQPKKKSPVKSVTTTKTKTGKEVDVLELESSDDENNNKKQAQADDGSDSDDEHDHIEAKELTGNIEKEKIPTSKAAFKQSPFYVIPSVLNSQDVLHPDARKRICGVFKGELVYRRSDVSKALREKKWLYQGRKVKESELDKPVKQIKARKKPVKKGFNALSTYGVSEEAQVEMISSINRAKGKEDNGMDNLYGIWQTEAWSPPYVGPNDAIPINQYKNVELALINPGLTHMDQPRLASVAKKLGLPYAPCMLGYEGHRGGGTPTIRGIVVHDHNVALLREAYVEFESHAIEKEQEERRKLILKRWKRLVKGILTKERLDREYG